MKIDSDDLLKSILDSLDHIKYIHPEDVPGIDLYMDQVTTFMDRKLRTSSRYPDEDKILTKTMINNYAKNDLLPAPVKKKYSKEHILVLIFIYYYKNILSIGDIQKLLKPITDQFFDCSGEFGIEEIYNEVFSMQREEVELLKRDVVEKYKKAQGTFADAPEKNQEFLKQFSFICLLTFDVYVKKLMIEKMIDELFTEPASNDKKSKKNAAKQEMKEKGNE